MPTTDSPLRYPGGKTQLRKFVVDIIKTNSISNNYIEPYVGGAGVALYLLLNKYVNQIYINDLDPSIYSFWFSILNDTDEFINLIESTPVTLDEWFNQREIQKNINNHSPLEIGFSTFFLNRTNVSGIIRGGPIGGKKQLGKYKLDCRFNKKNLIHKIKKIASNKDSIHLFNYDAEIFVENVISNLNPGESFIFFDPPYYEQGKNLYSNFYTHNDHVSLSNKIISLQDYYWITTYDHNIEIESMYSDMNKKIYSLNYSANNIRKSTELLFYSNRLILPDSQNINFVDPHTSPF